ncbi:TetR family transcriptional regulator C-terminal domain-containing protein [Cupriavidus sp. NPDC089707]|uniref:TetR family transcriptional regulator C-terminal domain-containing protein n=1 Tax=Cupriavidus sp. NPDC089707 TaxID=3363963 RepID=UPI0037F2C97E
MNKDTMETPGARNAREDAALFEGMPLKLVEATLEVVGQVGLENLTIRKVSEFAGVSVGLVHHHFDNKSDLVYRTFVYLIKRVREQLTAGRRDIADPIDRMKFTADMCFSDEVLSPGVANVWPHMWSSSAHDRQVQRLCVAFSRRLRSNFTHDLREAGCSRALANVYAIQAMGLVHGLWIEHRVAATISIEEVRGVFHGVIDDATGDVWKRNLRVAPRTKG